MRKIVLYGLASCILFAAGCLKEKDESASEQPDTPAVSKESETSPVPSSSLSLQPCVAAVDAGVGWLARHQSDDGRWDSDGFDEHCDTKRGCPCRGTGEPDGDISATSLALLSFLRRGDTCRVGRYKRTVKLGFDWLREQQAESGCFGDETPVSVETHAMATYAICEAFAVSRDYRLKENAQKAVDFLNSLQRSDGAWSRSGKDAEPDVVVTVWSVLALKAARTAGLNAPEEHFEKALKFFDSRTEALSAEDGAASCEDYESAAGIAIASIFCRREYRHETFQKLVSMIAENPLFWWNTDGPVYTYLATSAIFQCGGGRWRKWCEEIEDCLCDHQRTDGCAAGSWDPVGPGSERLGRVGTTSLNVLTLGIYYCLVRVNPVSSRNDEQE
jgi:hypothetical protein